MPSHKDCPKVRIDPEAYELLRAAAAADKRSITQTASLVIIAALQSPTTPPPTPESDPIPAWTAAFAAKWNTKLAPLGFPPVTSPQLHRTHIDRLQLLYELLCGDQAALGKWIQNIAESDYYSGRTLKRRRPADLKWLLENQEKVWEQSPQAAVTAIPQQQKPPALDAVLKAAELLRAKMEDQDDGGRDVSKKMSLLRILKQVEDTLLLPIEKDHLHRWFHRAAFVEVEQMLPKLLAGEQSVLKLT